MENIKEYISKKRPTLSKSSLTTYGSILKNLYKKVYEEDDYDLERFNSPAPVLKYLELGWEGGSQSGCSKPSQKRRGNYEEEQ